MEIENYLVELGGIVNGYFSRKKYIGFNESHGYEMEEFLNKTQNTDAYRSVYLYETNDIDNCLIYAPVYFDLDIEIENEADFKKIVRDTLMAIAFIEEALCVPKEYVRIFFSGSKGFHIMIEPIVFGIEPSKDLNEKLKVIASRVNKETMFNSIDTAIYDRKRLFRIANTINGKTGLYKVPISLEALRRADYDFMKEYASQPQYIDTAESQLVPEAKRAYERVLLIDKLKTNKKRHPKSVISISKKDLLPCVEKLLKEGVHSGGRNNACVAIASSVVQCGIEKDDAIELMLDWNTRNEPPLPESEVVRTVQSAHSLAQSGKGYGCNFFKDNDYCIGSGCSLFKR